MPHMHYSFLFRQSYNEHDKFVLSYKQSLLTCSAYHLTAVVGPLLVHHQQELGIINIRSGETESRSPTQPYPGHSYCH